tara:strand:+ start:9132 stop:9272 length:141 start_codon:yes stop_codon:yes gene_type:complete
MLNNYVILLILFILFILSILVKQSKSKAKPFKKILENIIIKDFILS